MSIQYADTANTLVERIVALIPKHPEILTLNSPWGLFKIADFDCRDLNPSLAQASWALAEAKHRALPNGKSEP